MREMIQLAEEFAAILLPLLVKRTEEPDCGN
jgi:hypothetical protein